MTQEVDVSDEARVIAAMSEAIDKLGRVDGVIANAGIMSHAGSFLQMSAEAYHGLLAINQHGAFYVAREAARPRDFEDRLGRLLAEVEADRNVWSASSLPAT
jgi:NAD(P)-dependent dehydrogenase (short-subunit alcohol dehydrogenase family)